MVFLLRDDIFKEVIRHIDGRLPKVVSEADLGPLNNLRYGLRDCDDCTRRHNTISR